MAATITGYIAFENSISVAVASNGAQLYLTWADSAGLHFSRSADAGASWMAATPVGNESTADSQPRLMVDSRGRLYLTWIKWGRYSSTVAQVAYSDDDGASWSLPQAVAGYFIGECAAGWDVTPAAGGGVHVVVANCGNVWLTTVSGGQLTSAQIYQHSNPDAISDLEVAATETGVYVLWREDWQSNQLIQSGDNWGSVSQVMSDSDGVEDLAGDNQGRLTALFSRSGFMYLAESADGGNSWRETALGPGDNGKLAGDPQRGTPWPVWQFDHRLYTAGRTRQVISTRSLNSHTLGVVGFMDTAAAASAEVRLERAGTALETVDALPLARHNAPGGGEAQSVSGAAGVWSVALHSATELTGQEEVVLTVTDSAGEVYQEWVDIPVPAGDLRLELQNIEVINRGAAGGLVRLSGLLEPPPANMPAVRVSRWQPATAGNALVWPGRWVEADGGAQPQPNGQWQAEQPALPGENLYRVRVEGYPGLEDVDGYFYVADPAAELGTDETHQRQQAVVFRDAVREVLADPVYGDTYPEQLIVAMGAQEAGGTTPERPYGFSNEGNGIMQVTCGSSYRGATAGVSCPNTYSYDTTAQGIDFNVRDALLALDGAFNLASSSNRPFYCQTIGKANGDVDYLITAVAYYNAWCDIDEKYKGDGDGPEPEGPQYVQRYYLREVAGHLENSPGNNLPNHLSIAEFFGDADYTDDELRLALEDGQNQICAFSGVHCD